ncbi:hypothetical protein EON65_26440 [archaeon]|nr:MAG: hypothetical protein EON65_26440 [archaeon]
MRSVNTKRDEVCGDAWRKLRYQIYKKWRSREDVQLLDDAMDSDCDHGVTVLEDFVEQRVRLALTHTYT